MIQFIIPVKAISKGRPRFSSGHTYTPKSTRDNAKLLKAHAARFKPLKPFSGPLIVFLYFYFQKPKSNKDLFCMNRKDLDNLAKQVLDSFNGLMWVDDHQVVALNVGKLWGLKDEISVGISGADETI